MSVVARNGTVIVHFPLHHYATDIAQQPACPSPLLILELETSVDIVVVHYRQDFTGGHLEANLPIENRRGVSIVHHAKHQPLIVLKLTEFSREESLYLGE
jgi:hypothetical protein